MGEQHHARPRKTRTRPHDPGAGRAFGTGRLRIGVWDLVAPLARTFDMMSPALAQHSLRVAYLALRLAEELELPHEERCEIAVAGTLHDIGAFSLRERLDLLTFEETSPSRHAAAGYLLLREFPHFAGLASLVRFHHVPWEDGRGSDRGGVPIPRGSHLLHLADRVAVLLPAERGVLGQVREICDAAAARQGAVFVPRFVEALLRLAERDYVWLDLVSGGAETALRQTLAVEETELDVPGLLALSRLVCRIIDFKSEFTATHSSGVAATARELASLIGFSARECTMFEIAAYLHDLGKLAIPSEILEKPGRLTPEEWDVMRTHVYYTYQILSPIEALGAIAAWSALHQERLDGSGYPFHFAAEDLPLGARIMAVADVFTAVTEDRPYRKGMPREDAEGLLREMADRGELDVRVIALLLQNFDELNQARDAAQTRAVEEYEAFRTALG